MPSEAEVAAIEAQIRGDGDFFAGSGAEDCAIVADAKADAAAARAGKDANAAEKFQLTAGISRIFRLGVHVT
jgi:hypothetical protein